MECANKAISQYGDAFLAHLDMEDPSMAHPDMGDATVSPPSSPDGLSIEIKTSERTNKQPMQWAISK